MESVQHHLRRGTTIAVAAAAMIGAVLFGAAPATAQPFTIIGVGTLEIPDEIPIPSGIPGIQVPSGNSVTPQRSTGEVAVAAARTKLGAPYRMGATGPNAFDCSGLVQWSYRQAGREVPRTSYQQLAAGTPVSLDELQTGDVVAYYGGSHSGLYAGNGTIIHAATYGVGVELAPVSSMPVSGARRF